MQEIIDKILNDCGYKDNPYFKALKEKSFSKEDFIETQIQFYFAVIFFSRPMAALCAKIPTPELRLEIVKNVWEEHGEGQLNAIHGTTFVEFLKRLGNVTTNDIEKRSLWPEIRIFNTTLSGVCILDEFLIGVGVMGMIERMFCEISTWLGQGIVNNNWIKNEKMIHYNLHEALDIKHSADFFNVLKPSWDKNSDNKYFIEQGLWVGAILFNNMYEGLYKNRGRRIMRNIKGPHTRAAGLS